MPCRDTVEERGGRVRGVRALAFGRQHHVFDHGAGKPLCRERCHIPAIHTHSHASQMRAELGCQQERALQRRFPGQIRRHRQQE
jgi:hypothetical protein